MSAFDALRVKRGSTQMILPPLSFARRIQRKATGWFSAGLAPMMRTTFAFFTSIQ